MDESCELPRVPEDSAARCVPDVGTRFSSGMTTQKVLFWWPCTVAALPLVYEQSPVGLVLPLTVYKLQQVWAMTFTCQCPR